MSLLKNLPKTRFKVERIPYPDGRPREEHEDQYDDEIPKQKTSHCPTGIVSPVFPALSILTRNTKTEGHGRRVQLPE